MLKNSDKYYVFIKLSVKIYIVELFANIKKAYNRVMSDTRTA